MSAPPCIVIETWKPIPGHDAYEVSDIGRVRSKMRVITVNGAQQKTRTVSERILRAGIASHGYPMVALGRGNSRTVHSLVAEAFLGPCPEGMEVLHADDNRQNPSLHNLSYGTRSRNLSEAWARGRRA